MGHVLPFESLFALAAGALILAITVAASLNRPTPRRIPIRRHDRR
jgi:hypothetical protein